jgi:hypothetical protein
MRRVGGEQAEYLVANGLGASLVGIETENPVMATGLDGAIAQVAESVERDLHHACTEARRNFGRAVLAVGIDDDNLVRPKNAFDRGPDLCRFIEADNGGGDFLHDPIASLIHSLRVLTD